MVMEQLSAPFSAHLFSFWLSCHEPGISWSPSMISPPSDLPGQGHVPHPLIVGTNFIALGLLPFYGDSLLPSWTIILQTWDLAPLSL
jgi:hypothetical protein